MLGAEANSSEALMVITAVSGIRRQHKWVVNAIRAPKGCPVPVIFKELWEDLVLLNVAVVICVESDEQKSCLVGRYTLVRLAGKQVIERDAWMLRKHDLRRPGGLLA